MADRELKSVAGLDAARYANEVMSPETDVQARLRAETAKLPLGIMQISADQGAFLAFLVRLTGARQVLEIGTFTGYSALSMAGALPADGHLTCLDQSEEWTAIARRYWAEAGLADRITLHLAPAGDSLKRLAAAGATFDMAFIDADKTGYDAYYEAVLPLLPAGGLIVFDNMIPRGLDEEGDHPMARAAHALNLKLRADRRVDVCLVTIGAGFTLIRKR